MSHGFWLEFCHLDGDDGALITLVAETASRTILGLLHVLCGQQTEDNGNVVRRVESGNALGDSLTDVVEMGSLAADDAAEDNDGVIAVVERHLVRSVD